MLEERFIGRAEMVEPRVARVPEPVLGTTTPTAFKPPAGPARAGQGGFPFPELLLPARIEHVFEAAGHDVPELPAVLDEEVAGINVAVVLDDDIVPAFREEEAFGRPHAHVSKEKGIEKADVGPVRGPDGRGPEVEDGDQEVPEVLGRRREGGRPRSSGTCRGHARGRR